MVFIYFLKKKEDSYTKKDEKDILNTTFAGYCLIIGAHIILFLPITGIFGPVNDIALSVGLSYGLLMIIGVILLSVGLSHSNESDKKMKELKSASIMAPVLLAITGILYGIVPYCCNIFNISPPILKTQTSISKTSINNPLMKELNSQIKFIENSKKTTSPEKNLANALSRL